MVRTVTDGFKNIFTLTRRGHKDVKLVMSERSHSNPHVGDVDVLVTVTIFVSKKATAYYVVTFSGSSRVFFL